MARPSTRSSVHDAVLTLVTTSGYRTLTMEGIAARAGVSKQTLYRTWSSPADILFDALLFRSTDTTGAVVVPNTGDLAQDLETLIIATAEEFVDPANDRLLRAVTAEIQSDEALARQLLDNLLGPQLNAVSARLRSGGATDPDTAVELLYGPMFYRWLLRTGPLDEQWAQAHVRLVVRALQAPSGPPST